MDFLTLNYAAVVITFLICIWTLRVGANCNAEDIPFGEVGRVFLIFNSFILIIVCAVTFIWHVYEYLQGKI